MVAVEGLDRPLPILEIDLVAPAAALAERTDQPARRRIVRTHSGSPFVALSMTHRNAKVRPTVTAIAAVLALSSTQLSAQVAPGATQPVTQAIPVTEGAPLVPTGNEPSATIASDPIAPSVEPATTTTRSGKSTTTHRTASVARSAKAAPPVARTASPTAAAAVSVAEPAQTVTAAPVPLATVSAVPPPAVAAAPLVPTAPNNMLPIAALGLVLLALIGLAVVMRRGKLRREEELAAYKVEPAFEGPVAVDPLFAKQQAPAPLAAQSTAAVAEPALAGPCADAAPGSHVEAACEGPTDDNPSLSIKKRIKRAQFFDQREQLVAAGMAVPVEADAGLPSAHEAPDLVPPARELT